MTDGLDSLSAMRTKATSRRAVPPPRHPPRKTPVPKPEPPQESTALPELASPQTAVVPAPTSGTELIKVSIYLDEHADTYLETIRTAARRTKPKVDATRSAVVRLALNRLADQLSETQVVDELRRSAAEHSGPGRKRA